MVKIKMSGIKTAVFAALTIMFLFELPAGARAVGELPPFNPQKYSAKEIPSRDPWGEKPWFMAPFNEARGYLMLGYLSEAMDKYKALRNTVYWDNLKSEYAYLMGLNGYYEPALTYLDEAHIKTPSKAGPYYYAGWIFAFAGYGDIAKNFWKIAQGDTDPASSMASDALNNEKNIGVLSFAGVDKDFINELDYPEIDGVVVLNVYPGKFMTHLQKRDIIIKAGDKTVEDIDMLTDIINSKPAGSTLDLVIWRGGLKQALSVKVNSMDDISAMAEPSGRAVEPPKKAKSMLAGALSMFVKKKYFTAIFLYRQIIEAYPDWSIPYLGYSLALEKVGAFQCAKKAVEQAIKASENDAETKSELKEKIKQIKNLTLYGQNSWRQAQTLKSLSDQPPVFFLGFGGGQMAFGGGKGFTGAISGRMGMITNTNNDLSLNLNLSSTGGFSLNLNMAQRIYADDTFSFNPGFDLSYSTSGAGFSCGVSAGISAYAFNGKSSTDMVVSIPSILSGISIQAIRFYIGMTYYL